MLILKTLRLENWCQHSNREVVFTPGLNGIIGSNGSGKSNILRAIQRVLQGGTGSSIGVKEDDVSWGQENGKITLNFNWDGVDYKLTRAVKGSSSRLVFGDTKLNGASVVDEHLHNLFGANSKVIGDIVFVAQEKIGEIIFQLPSERTKMFHSLLGLDAAEKIRSVLTDKLATLPVESNQDYIVRLEQQINTNAAELTLMLEQFAGIKCLSQLERMNFKETIRAYTEYLKNKNLRGAAETKFESAKTEKEQAEASITRATERHASLKLLLEESKSYYLQAKEVIDRVKVTNMRLTLRKEALEKKAEAERIIAGTKVPVVQSFSELAEITSELATDKHELTTSTQILAAVGGKSVCPTCKQPVPSQMIEQHREKAKDLTAKIGRMTVLVDKLKAERAAAEKAALSANRLISSAQSDLTAACKMLQETQDAVEISAEELAKYRQIVSDYDGLSTEVNVTNAELVLLRQTVEKCVEVMIKQAAILQSIPKCAAVSDDDYKLATVTIAADDELVSKSDTLKGKISMLEKSLEGDRATIADLKNRDAQSQGIRKLRGLFEEARSVLHRDQLPAVAARAFLKSLNVGLNKQLSSFNQPFTAKIEDDLSFNCCFEEKVTAAARLSGGQKVALAVATRLALYDMIAASLGLLALDEPTAYLDKDNIDHLVAVLEVVKHRAHNAGMQVIVPTHEVRLISVFDNVIRL